MMNMKEQEAIQAVYEVFFTEEEANDVIENNQYTFWEVPDHIHMSVEEYYGVYFAEESGVLQGLKDMGVDEFFDFETYGKRLTEDGQFYKLGHKKMLELHV